MVQFGGERFHPGEFSLVAPLLLIVFVICVSAVFLPVIAVAVSGVRSGLRSWRARRRLLRTLMDAEPRARMLMSELCPNGWRAQLTLEHGTGEPVGVALEWTELEDETGRAAVMRRIWAPTINEALEAMVADRRTDETLEQIERAAFADGSWPEP